MIFLSACQWNLDKVVLDCDLVDCVNGVCNDNTGECECEDGWMGVLCDVLNLCEGVDCANGMSCNEGTGDCECEDGYWGINCDKEVITFEKTFGGSNHDNGYSVKQTIDGGFIITGSTKSYGNGLTDVYLLKTDANGNELWSKTFGGSSWDQGNSISQTIDGGFIITGYYTTDYDRDVYLLKTDANGNELWSKTFGGNENDEVGSSVIQTTDNGFVIVGSTENYEDGDIYLIKTDSGGNEMWSETFGGSGDEKGRSVEETIDGGLIITGYTESYGNVKRDVYLIKTDMNGDGVWSKTFGEEDYYENGLSVKQTIDGGFIITGYGRSVYLIKTDINGNELWSREIGGLSDIGYSIDETIDGSFIVTGHTIYNICLIKTDSDGNELWNKTFGESDDDVGYFVKQTTDGGFIITGRSSGNGSEDVYLIKTDANGNL